ncbi:MAG: hypothetical protein AABZ20_05725 [candidate division NC10 bacterium]
MFENLAAAVESAGYAVIPEVLSAEECDRLSEAFVPFAAAMDAGRRGGVRNLLGQVAAVQELARSKLLRQIAEALLGPGCFAVRGVLFDKTPQANWKVVWHQDLSIAVRERRDVEGFGPWSSE